MLKRIYAVVLLCTISIASAGCATYLPLGFVYTEVKAPVAVAGGDVSYSKVGSAMATSVLGIVATGDASIRAAMEDGNINRVKHVEYSVKNILGIYGEYTTTVYGD